jgi:hypothetical protein
MVWNVAKIGTKHSDPVLGPSNAPDQKRAKMNAIKKYTAAPVF